MLGANTRGPENLGLASAPTGKGFWPIPVSDMLATVTRIANFAWNRKRWRDGVYTIRKPSLVPAAPGNLQLHAERKG